LKVAKLESDASKLGQQVSKLQTELLSQSVDLDVLRHRLKLSTDRLSFLQKFEPESQKLKEENKLQNMKLQRMENCVKFNPSFLEGIETWDLKVLSNFTGLQDYSSIEILIKLYQYHGIGAKLKTLNTKFQTLLFLFKLRLDLSNRVLSVLFSTSESLCWIDIIYAHPYA